MTLIVVPSKRIDLLLCRNYRSTPRFHSLTLNMNRASTNLNQRAGWAIARRYQGRFMYRKFKPLFFWPEQYRRTGELSMARLLGEIALLWGLCIRPSRTVK